ENEFYKDLPDIKKHLSKTLTEGGLYRTRPDLVRLAWIAAAIVIAIGVVAIGSAIAARYAIPPVAAFIAGPITGIIVAAFGWHMPRRTPEGARMHAWLRGFEEFL